MFDKAEADPALTHEQFQRQESRLRTALVMAQYERLRRADRALLIVVAGIDGAGKGATVNLLNEWMDPRHIRTLAFGAPDANEVRFPPMWRYWNGLPAKGETAIVFGSWYAPLLAEAFRKHPDDRRIAALAASIRDFEAMLAAEGTQVLKLWYHLSADAQKARTRRLLSSPETAWQVHPEDRLVKKHYGRLREAGRIALEQTHAGHAPWVVIPSADDGARAVATAQVVLKALQGRVAAARPPAGAPPRGRVPDRLGKSDYDEQVGKNDYDERLAALQARLARAVRQDAFRRRSLVLVFEGEDAAGKGGAIRRVTAALDARQFDITQISAPAAHELARPYLWRFWRNLPPVGRIGIFDRSWYGRVLVERVEGLTPVARWKRAYGEIKEFEAQLTAHGAIVVKFWLAISPDEQLRRFRAREKEPFKRFKITPDDWRNRRKWRQYSVAANEMLARTDSPDAPWRVVATNDKRLARLQVLTHVVAAVEGALQDQGSP